MNQQTENIMIHKLGKTNIKITSIIMGCWQMNGTPYWRGVDDRTSRAAVLSALSSGINTFDTAAVYGQSEIVLGKTLKKYRQDIIIATKVFSNKLDYEQVLVSCENSLKNLQTDYIDLLQIHFPSGAFQSTLIPIEETMAAFSKLKKAGKIRAIGVSNFSLSQLKEARKYEEIDSIQPPYSLFWRSPVDELRSYCEENDISIPPISDKTFGMRSAPHGDINLLTLLPASTESGLELLDKNGVWHPIPGERNSIIVNTADMLDLCTSGYYKSVIHRVTNPTDPQTNKSRYAAPFFVHPHQHVDLKNGFTAGEYWTQRLKEIGLFYDFICIDNRQLK